MTQTHAALICLYKCLYKWRLAAQGLNQPALPLLIYFCHVVLIYPQLLPNFYFHLLLVAALKTGKQEVGLSPKHITNAIIKRIKEDIVPGPPEEIMRARFAVSFRTLTHALPIPLSSLFLPFVGTDFKLCEGSLHKVIQQTFIVPFDAVFMTFLPFSKPSTYLSLQCLPQVQRVCARALFSAVSRRVMDCGPTESVPWYGSVLSVVLMHLVQRSHTGRKWNPCVCFDAFLRF